MGLGPTCLGLGQPDDRAVRCGQPGQHTQMPFVDVIITGRPKLLLLLTRHQGHRGREVHEMQGARHAASHPEIRRRTRRRDRAGARLQQIASQLMMMMRRRRRRQVLLLRDRPPFSPRHTADVFCRGRLRQVQRRRRRRSFLLGLEERGGQVVGLEIEERRRGGVVGGQADSGGEQGAAVLLEGEVRVEIGGSKLGGDGHGGAGATE
ncbi:uncharacterized protein G2W53_006932 [Senna tora]|uniref:Uncharacterized protein n=1 Tax=Senna tora TaxID=362788 RepID=A0A834X5X2_9FABA|nr:uncharacterized protein G2W53_006932 [Senna tora]